MKSVCGNENGHWRERVQREAAAEERQALLMDIFRATEPGPEDEDL